MALHKFSLQDLISKGRGERVLKSDKERGIYWRGEGVVWGGYGGE